jgi:hypothetical protein
MPVIVYLRSCVNAQQLLNKGAHPLLNAFSAMKEAKRAMLGKAKKVEFTEKVATETGLQDVIVEAEKARKELDLAARKQEEFPEDEESNIALEIAESNLDAIVYAGEEIVKENTSVSEILQNSKSKWNGPKKRELTTLCTVKPNHFSCQKNMMNSE